jgi:hypothetical protein
MFHLFKRVNVKGESTKAGLHSSLPPRMPEQVAEKSLKCREHVSSLQGQNRIYKVIY